MGYDNSDYEPILHMQAHTHKHTHIHTHTHAHKQTTEKILAILPTAQTCRINTLIPTFFPLDAPENETLIYSGTSLIRTYWDQSFCPLYRGVRYSGGTKVTCILIS